MRIAMRQTNKITRHWRREISEDVVCSYEKIYIYVRLLSTCSLLYVASFIFSLSHLLTYLKKIKQVNTTI